MSSSTPSAAKRRRVDVANDTLRKPFKSPLINRSAAAGGPSASATKLSSPLAAVPTPSRTARRGLPPPPSTPLAGPRRGGVSSINRSSLPRPAGYQPATTSTNATANSPIKTFTGRGLTTPSKSTSKPPQKDASTPNSDADSLRAKLDKTRESTKATIRALQAENEILRQADRIVRESERRRPGEEVDAELREVTAKWKGASRIAAEELFELVKGRVEGMGGVGGMSRRGRGFDDEEERRRREEGGEDGGEGERERVRVREREREKEKEANEEGFTMLMMLKSLNIDPDLLGWDQAEEKWLD